MTGKTFREPVSQAEDTIESHNKGSASKVLRLKRKALIPEYDGEIVPRLLFRLFRIGFGLSRDPNAGSSDVERGCNWCSVKH